MDVELKRARTAVLYGGNASGQIGGGAQNWLMWASLVFAALEIREARNRRYGVFPGRPDLPYLPLVGGMA
jgi:hypothetical protein